MKQTICILIFMASFVAFAQLGKDTGSPVNQDILPVLKRNTTKMMWPLKEKAFVFWGGEKLEQNRHMRDKNELYAYDILMVANGAPFKGDSKKNESYFIFGKDLMAPCDGKIVKVIDGVKDNVPGVENKNDLSGNTIVIKTDKNEFIFMAHLKENSINVKEGDFVKQGQTIAQCGNSGNSTMAHLHLHLQNTVELLEATGAKLFFDKIVVNGKIREDYMPVKEDFVENIDKSNQPK